MQQTNNGNLLEIIDLAHSLRQEHLFIANEQNTFIKLADTLKEKALNVAQVCDLLYLHSNQNLLLIFNLQITI